MAEIIESIRTPLGELVCERWDEPEYPGFNILLRPKSGGEILLATAEFAKEAGKIKLRTYGDPRYDMPDYMTNIDENFIRRCQEESE